MSSPPLGDRWDLESSLGRGGHGEVWTARDRLTGERVAVKLLGDGRTSRLESAREAAALRLLRLPGVVRLLDEGVEGERSYLVMELVDGGPFPGLGAPDEGRGWSWDRIERPTRQLLEILARIHASGLVHLDLKPGNVLVDAGGRPTVLDLGLAAGRAFAPWDVDERPARGTLRYAAPEQLLGRATDGRADLYALGMMVFECLTGRNPRQDWDGMGYLTRVLRELPPRVESLAPGVPRPVADLVAALLDPEPARRPRSAADALGRLEAPPEEGVRALVASASDGLHGAPLDLAALRSLFRGPDRLLHVAEDAARVLLGRTQGDPARAARELEAWVASGLACWDGERVALDRRDLLLLVDEHAATADLDLDPDERKALHASRASAAPPGSPGRLIDLMLAEDYAACPAECRAAALRLLRQGRFEEAAAVLFEGWVVLRDFGAPPGGPGEPELLALWTRAALAGQDLRLLARLQPALAEAAERDGAVEVLGRLVRAAQAALGTDGARALERLDGLGPLDDPQLERWRLAYRLYSARFVDRSAEERALVDFEAFCERHPHPELRAAGAALRGRYLYRTGRFAEAAEAYHGASAIDPARVGALSDRINAASAWMEAADLDRARREAESALLEAAEARRPLLEAHATWIARACAYRAGESPLPDRELLAALAGLGHPDLEAQIRLQEAVLAWRHGELELARDLALATAHHARERSHHSVADLAALVAREAGATLEPGALGEIAARLATLDSSALRAQLAGLLARAGCPVEPAWREEARALALAGDPRRRWEVLDALELLEALAP